MPSRELIRLPSHSIQHLPPNILDYTTLSTPPKHLWNHPSEGDHIDEINHLLRRRNDKITAHLSSDEGAEQDVVEEEDTIEGGSDYLARSGVYELMRAGDHTGRQRCGQDELNEPICT